jgi:hypothetical protein
MWATRPCRTIESVGLVMIAPTRGWPLPNDLIRLFQPLLPLLRHRRDQTPQEGPLGFVFVGISGLRFAIHAQTFRHPGLCYPLLPQGGSCHREGPHSSCGLLAVRLGPLSSSVIRPSIVRPPSELSGRSSDGTRASIAVRRCAFVSPRSTTLLVALIRLIIRRRLDNPLPARGGGRESPQGAVRPDRR